MNTSTTLWYEQPAKNWDEALPIGNGRIGGMVFGKPNNELIQLNEDSIWSGGFRIRNNPKAYPNLTKMRNLIRDGKTTDAENLCFDAFIGTNENQRHYQPLGDFHLYQDEADEYSNYKRSLELSDGIAYTQYTVNGVNFVREVFVSKPDECMVILIKSDKQGTINLTALIDGRDDNYDKNEAYDDKTLIFTVSDGIPYAAAISCSCVGGKSFTDANRIKILNADMAMITIACQTSYRTGNYEKIAITQAKNPHRYLYEKVLNKHINDYKNLYNRAEINLCDNSDGNSALSTDKRLQLIKDGKQDNKLIEMYFNFSRYLLIAGSREGTLPLNLQGIWNKDMWPAWGGKYTININTEMNYWGAEIANLSECHYPLFDHIERMRENGRVTAREMYHCKGTVCHHNTDIWGDTAPQDKWLPATIWPMGLAWLCLHIYEHYRFTKDKLFLAEKYDTIKETAEFFEDYLIEDEKGRLVTSPSVSPENTYKTVNGANGTLCQGPSMDSQILHELFTAVIEASEILDFDKDYADNIRKIRERLPKPQIGQYGQIMEWAEDFEEVEPGHRHISQLFALYPSDMISLRNSSPELVSAARATIERRLAHGGGHTGWSRAWIINMWARLHDSEKVKENIAAILAHSTNPNMFDMHPPFQIDGNFGAGAGISEAILQSHSGILEFLPALPKEWENGSVKSLCARGGFEVTFTWENNAVKTAKIFSKAGELCKIYSTRPIKILNNDEYVEVSQNGATYTFNTNKGEEYDINY
mgnify:CR=1 FL=1